MGLSPCRDALLNRFRALPEWAADLIFESDPEHLLKDKPAAGAGKQQREADPMELLGLWSFEVGVGLAGRDTLLKSYGMKPAGTGRKRCLFSGQRE